MAETQANWLFADSFVVEDDTIAEARESAAQFGIVPIAASTGAELAFIAAARRATSIIEIGTGTGVSGLWLLHGAPGARLTTIDTDLDHHQVARTFFAQAGYLPKQVRLITGDADAVLPRMNEEDYDVVFLDADPEHVHAHLDHAVRLARPAGVIVVAHVLAGGKVANPAKRDRVTVAYRELLRSVRDRDDLLMALSASGDGLLQIVKRA